MIALCLVEREGEAIASPSAAAARFAVSLASASDGFVVAVLFGPGDPPAELADSDVARVCTVDSPQLTGYAPAAWARSLQQLADKWSASAIVAASTDRGSEVMAHLGAMTGLPIAANCISATPAGPDRWELVRHRWAGSVLEEAILDAPVALLTVATDAVQADPLAANPGRAGPARDVFTPDLDPADLRMQSEESVERAGGESLATARVVVGGGRGVGGPDGFTLLEELATLLGGVVGVSRVVTSAGWRPHRQQVGQTGTKISPEVYLACGISGAIQHMAGCLSARHIIAVNTDPDAPIISRADYAVIADLHELIPALVAAVKDRAAAGSDSQPA